MTEPLGRDITHHTSSATCAAVILDAAATPDDPKSCKDLRLVYTLQAPTCDHETWQPLTTRRAFQTNLAEITLKVLANRQEAFRLCMDNGESWSQKLEQVLWKQSLGRIARALGDSTHALVDLKLFETSGDLESCRQKSASPNVSNPDNTASPLKGRSFQETGCWETEDMFALINGNGLTWLVKPCSYEKRGVVVGNLLNAPAHRSADSGKQLSGSDPLITLQVQAGWYLSKYSLTCTCDEYTHFGTHVAEDHDMDGSQSHSSAAATWNHEWFVWTPDCFDDPRPSTI